MKRTAAGLWTLLLGLYLLAYTGLPGSADGQALLAVADTLVTQGRFDIHVIGYTEWLLTEDGRMGSLGIDGALYAKKGITPSLALTPLVFIGHLLPGPPVRAVALLFNPLITATTAVLLYAFALRLAYSQRTAFALGLIFGLATFAAVYVKTLFGEPLAALLLLGAVMAAPRRPGVAAWCLGLLVGVNTIYLLLIPVIALYAFWQQPITRRGLTAFLVPLIICGLLLALYNTARFGSPLASGYHFDSGEGFSTPLLPGLYGLTLSPYRGLFWYSPVLLLVLPGGLLFRRQHPRLLWLVLALTGGLALVFATWWSWHGGIVWGPRFLLPVLPLLVLLLAPLVESAAQRCPLALVIIALAALSLAIQLLGVLYDYLPYEGLLRQRFYPDLATANMTLLTSPPMFDPAYSPILGHLALLRVGWPLDPLWLHGGIDGVALLLAAAVMFTGWLLARRGLLACVISVLLGLFIIRQPITESVTALNTQLQPPGTAVIASALFDDALLDTHSRIIAMNAPTDPADSRAQTMWRYALQQPDPLWLVTWFGPADPLNWQERELWQSAYFAGESTAAGHRFLRFHRAADDSAPTIPGGWRFGPLRLDHYHAEQSADGVRLLLAWSAAEAVSADYGWFVHLIDSAGNILAQHDRTPQGGYAPTAAWLTGERVEDRLFFPLTPGAVGIRIGWLDNGDRLPVFSPQGDPLPDGFVILNIS